MFKVPEVAQQLNCSISTIYGLVDTGKLVAHRIGVGRGAVRIAQTDLDLYLASCRTQKTEGVRKLPRSRLRHIRL
ncbi:MAG: helix-turn-helix domain-containing protein [Planctomycetaceae bacterium]|nr:helix-turn-helix domain-containing protein [Planctomycetaceae bacterium]